MSDTLALPKGTSRRRLIAAATAGNALEFYDFTLYSFFVLIISKLYFPVGDPLVGILLALGTYGVGFLVRPLGGAILGSYADRAGRKSAVVLTLVLMAMGTLLIGLAPTYASVGIAGPLVLVFGRLLQGFSAGGEVGASTTLLVEHAPPESRGFFGSWQVASQGLGVALAAFAALVVFATLPQDAAESWGWRIPFLLGTLILPVGIALRATLEESLPQITEPRKTKAAPLRIVFNDHWRRLIIGILVVTGGTATTTVVLFYMSTYAVRTLQMPPVVALGAALCAGLISLLAAPLFGRLSDRLGRRPLMMLGILLTMASIYPAFVLLNMRPTPVTLLGVVLLLSIFNALANAPGITALTEYFPTLVRATGLGLVYAGGVTIFGGFGQFFVVWLAGVTGNPLSPAFYVIAACVLSLIGIYCMPERSRVPLD